jgi:hypothetical protein
LVKKRDLANILGPKDLIELARDAAAKSVGTDTPGESRKR